ncbi:phosphoribosyltransferase [Sulfurimonas sp. SAG-AH-194-C21]|nr:phosphoribosyltransferase family protein [Sulfurimonas sp. SAG-AH-194-C21]MDF1882363.1 phosphoribosyltransferase [Sulfurimonas sp. SAG-AH-194-C21]
MKQYYSYEAFRDDTKKLIHKSKVFKPESIVAIARGGLTLAHCMAEGLNLREVQSIRTELYDKETKREEITLFGSCDFGNKTRVLVVDDIADSGETLQVVMSYLQSNFENVEFQSATLFYKKSSLYEPHFWINEANNWIEFFWEKDFL